MKQQKGRFSFLAPDDPHAFVTEKDIDEAIRLEKKFCELRAQARSIQPAALIENFRQARANYMRSPSEKTLRALKDSQIDVKHFQGDTTIRSLAKAALKQFFVADVKPWAAAILKRALASAQGRLAHIRTEEADRVLKLTGHPMTRSDIVDQALNPVRTLETYLRGCVDGQTASDAQLYRPRRILALFGFDHVLPDEKPDLLDASETRLQKLAGAFKSPSRNGASRPQKIKAGRRGSSRSAAAMQSESDLAENDIKVKTGSINFDAALPLHLQEKPGEAIPN